MEQVSVYLHLLVGGSGHGKEIIGVFQIYKAVLFPMHHKDRISEGADFFLEPGKSVAEGVAQTGGEGLGVPGILTVPFHNFSNRADTGTKLIRKFGMGIQPFRNAGDQSAVVPGQGAACDNAAQLFIRIFGSVQGNSKASHAVAEKKYGNVRMFLNGHVYKNIHIVQYFIKIAVIGAFSLGAAMTAVIKAVGADSGGMQLICKIIITSLMLTQSVYDNHGCPAGKIGFLFHIQLGTVERRNHLFAHSKTPILSFGL